MANHGEPRAKSELLKHAQHGNLHGFKAIISAHNRDENLFTYCHDRSGDTALILASRHGRLDILRFLLDDCGQDFEQTNADGKRPLHESAQNGHVECTKLLLEKCCRVDCLKRADWTPLMLACTKSSLEMVRVLVEAGAAPELCNKDGWNCFHIACRSRIYTGSLNQYHICRCPVDIRRQGINREGHASIVNYLLDRNGQLWNTVSKNGRTPLHTAALHGCTSVIEILLTRGKYPPDQRDSCGSTPLMDALRAGFTEAAKILIDQHKADIFAEDLLGRQAIHLCSGVGCVASVEFLVKECGVDRNVVSSKYNTTALHAAAKENQHEALSSLLALGADLDVRDLKGRTALHIASGSQAVECVRILLEHGASDCLDKNGHYAATLARKPELKQLLEGSHIPP